MASNAPSPRQAKEEAVLVRPRWILRSGRQLRALNVRSHLLAANYDDSTSQGGYGSNSAGDSFSRANQTVRYLAR